MISNPTSGRVIDVLVAGELIPKAGMLKLRKQRDFRGSMLPLMGVLEAIYSY